MASSRYPPESLRLRPEAPLAGVDGGRGVCFELFARGVNAADMFGNPVAGTPVEVD